MSLSLSEVLAHPSLAAGRPVVRAGEQSLFGLVRWVHSSEVFDIAHLLRGGELLLTGGLQLADADGLELRRYVRDLAARRVAAVAIETGPHLPQIPAALIEEAAQLGFPIVELRGVVPFVEVAEAINGLIVNESVQRLRRGDRVARELSRELARGGGPGELLAALAELSNCGLTLLDARGGVIAACGDGELGDDPNAVSASAPVTVQGVTVAVLHATPNEGTDAATVEAIIDRAPAALAISLMRTFPASTSARTAQALFRMLAAPGAAPERLLAAARAAGLADQECHVVVVARSVDSADALAAVDAALHRHSPRAVSSIAAEELQAIVVLARDDAASRQSLLRCLRTASQAELARVAVGPPIRGLRRLAATLAEARYSLDVVANLGMPDSVVDASELAIERLGQRIDDPALLSSFVREVLGGLLDAGAGRARRLIATLDTYLQCGCNKTEAAAVLHVQRQTLHQRLEQIFTLLGEDPTGTPRLAAVHFATRLYLCGLVDRSVL